MLYTKKISVFYVCTERELECGDLEECLYQFLAKKPSKRYRFDLFLFFNKISNINRLENLISQINANVNINEVSFFNLNLDEEDDLFWYPWSKSPKPKIMPKLGYTSGANQLFYQSIWKMINNKNKYENFLMLESDTFCLSEFWFDKMLKYIKKNKFEIAGSKYKGNQKCHKDSELFDHINGVAIYKNSKNLKELLTGGREYIINNIPASGYMNFDISNFLFHKEGPKKYNLIDTDFIINLSDPRDYKISKEEILNKYPNAIIIHQKRRKENKIINADLFKNSGHVDKAPVFLCNFKGASSYVINCLNQNMQNEHGENFIKIKVLSPMGGKVMIHALTNKSFMQYPKEFFEDSEDNSYICKIFQLRKLISEDAINVKSIILDTRYSSEFEVQTFINFHIIKEAIKKDLFIYGFMQDTLSFAPSAFSTYEKANFGGMIEDEIERKTEFHKYLSNTDDFNFFIKKIIGIAYPSEAQFNHLCNILKHVNLYRINSVKQVLNFIFSNFLDISEPTYELYEKPIDKINTDYINNLPVIRDRIEQSAKFYKIIYENIAKDFSPKKILNKRRVPVLFHVPKNAGTFLIGTMTRFFVRLLDGDRNTNMQRLHIQDEQFQGIMVFAFMIHESWKSDERITENKNPAPRARSIHLSTLLEYEKENKLVILGAAVESNLTCECIEQFNKIWDILQKGGFYPLNFAVIRDPWSRAQSMFAYLNSDTSSHEETNFTNKFKDFKSYLSSEMMEDSWVVRQIARIPNSEPITYQKCNEAISWMKKNKFACTHIKGVKYLIENVLYSCYNTVVEPSDLVGKVDNINKYEKVGFEDLDEDTQKKFKDRVKFDTLFNTNILNQ